MSPSKSEETTAQKIKRLERELEDEWLKNLIINKMNEIFDQQYGTAIRKMFFPKTSGASGSKNK